ncbi:ABC transporter ATP-binding protein [Conexibacter sp. JD483]|uniref:ABC transporter ATP-binding protein n=1 Tax=unclassified Conexibacter TaxID=2627773 RepID=UPI002727BBA9|nr:MULTISPECIES: ABC transporter ATP-binding protein [unclassified Conexibacter]MDO8184080.1 ABC transporter ATP-binding protein [Conexibacter sp. CPCC 205706]MDO8197072.1 ABC transporter ATP-binding protein [Conexibacter sp. CPCC 205762]MDR9371111.1 ABC transporter ATP-binding protein [Conexibacter sp. JD483]
MSSTRAAAAVAVENVSKAFRVPTERVQTLKETALHPFRRKAFHEFVALRDVSFDVAHGEFLGIVGRNGSGKSTLLKCMAGIYRVDNGGIYVDGRLSAFIELGVGFNPDLPARDNVLINGTMLGLSPREASRRYDSILDFAELREFETLKIKNYSSGMLVRLAFSVMIHVDADILLVDEVLAVGDAAFQQKCFDEFYRLKDENRTVILVTHDMSAVERFCDRAVLLHKGDMVSTGEPRRIGMEYLELNFGRPEAAAAAASDELRSGIGGAEIVEAWFEDVTGARASMLELERDCRFAARVRFTRAVDHPVFAVTLENAAHDKVFSASTQWQHAETGRFEPGDEALFHVQFTNVLAPGRYDATPAVALRGGTASLDVREQFVDVVVSGTHASGALLELPYASAVERTDAQPAAAEPVVAAEPEVER